MSIVKMLSLILLAAWLVFNNVFDIFNLNVGSTVNFIVGLFAAASGILILLSVREFFNWQK